MVPQVHIDVRNGQILAPQTKVKISDRFRLN
jgi:hypothetical protein